MFCFFFLVTSWFVKILFVTLSQLFSVPLFALRNFNLAVAVESREKFDIMEAVVDFLNMFHVNASGFSVTLSLFLIFLGLLYWWVNGLNPSLSVMLQLVPNTKHMQQALTDSQCTQSVDTIWCFKALKRWRFWLHYFGKLLKEDLKNILVQTDNKLTSWSCCFVCSNKHQSTCKIWWGDFSFSLLFFSVF